LFDAHRAHSQVDVVLLDLGCPAKTGWRSCASCAAVEGAGDHRQWSR
jgi:hypothetical protein